MHSLSWDNYQYVLAIHRCQTLAGAARLLGVNETTVSRRLAQTEKNLQLRLFSRRSTGLVPTDSGLQLIRRLERAKFEIDEAESEILTRHSSVGGALRIAGNAMLLNNMLVPGLYRLLDQYPAITCELVSVHANESIKDSDIAVRYGDTVSKTGLVDSNQSLLLGKIEFGAFASHSWGDNTTDNAQIPWLVQLEDGTDWLPHAETNRLRVVSADTLLSCAIAGLGKCRLPLGVGQRHPELLLLDDSQAATGRDVVRICQPELLGTARLDACDEWLKFCVDTFADPRAAVPADERQSAD